MQSVTIDVPRCWADLLDIEEFEEAVRDGDQYEKAIDNPKPFSDDYRSVHGYFPDGVLYELALMSGQSNYFLCAGINGKEIFEQSDYTHSIGDGESWEFKAGYQIVVRLVEKS